MWFKDLFGFNEISPENVRKNINIEGSKITSKVNGKTYEFGTLQIPTLKELKETSDIELYNEIITVNEIIGSVEELHCEATNKSALFQVASQFNLLEMASPKVTPENGVDRYEHDHTQGPACAIACGAGTIYRNYFVNVNNQIGQSSNNQIDCLDLIGQDLCNEELRLWKMENGYTLVNQQGILNINSLINNLNNKQREQLKEKLKIGIQWNTEVTISESKQLVSQVYCSALPVAYSNVNSIYWESFSRLILEATYEATLHAALINYKRTNSNKVFLTLVGGGAFGNRIDWITDSILVAIRKFKKTPLDISIVSYKSSNIKVSELIKEI
tara:strand:+ start:5009 stop:5995 length:987 start_codon:yes stop_codon:yes gene_type:complete